MRETQSFKPSIGAEIPYRRDQIGKPTGSLVFDQHLKQTLEEERESSTTQTPPEADASQAGRV